MSYKIKKQSTLLAPPSLLQVMLTAFSFPSERSRRGQSSRADLCAANLAHVPCGHPSPINDRPWRGLTNCRRHILELLSLQYYFLYLALSVSSRWCPFPRNAASTEANSRSFSSIACSRSLTTASCCSSEQSHEGGRTQLLLALVVWGRLSERETHPSSFLGRNARWPMHALNLSVQPTKDHRLPTQHSDAKSVKTSHPHLSYRMCSLTQPSRSPSQG